MRAFLGICVTIVIGQWSLAAAEDAFDRAEAIAKQAGVLQEAGKQEAANQLLKPLLAEYEAAARRTPQDPPLLAGLARLQAQSNDDATAAKTLEAALRLQPRDARFYFVRGWLHLRADNDAAAEPDFRRSVELAPRAPKLRFNYAALLANLDRCQEAEAQARAMLDLDARNADAITLWSTMRFKNGHVDDALGTLRAGVELHPQHSKMHQVLGYVLQEQNQLTAAYAEFQTAYQLNREAGSVVACLITLSSQLKKTEDLDAYVTQLYWLHRQGKYKERSFVREKFSVGAKTIGAMEYFAPDEDHPTKYLFDVLVNDDKEQSTFSLVTARELHKFFPQPNGDESQPMSALMHATAAGTRTHSAFAAQPTYEQTRRLVTEILEGKRPSYIEPPAAKGTGGPPAP